MQHSDKLNGWKAIARHLGRSERTIQLWEAGRGLPVHRIPGTTGWTVYAYVQEVDAWMRGSEAAHGESMGVSPAPSVDSVRAPQAKGRAPGVLVLPFAIRSTAFDCVDIDAYPEEMIASLAAHHPALRVLSWTTSRKQRENATSMDALSREHGVRYVIEGSVRHTNDSRRIDLRIVDAEIDRVLIVDRFASSRLDDVSFRTQVVHDIVEHFSLVRAGALVERLHAHEIDPEAHMHYLEGVRQFMEGSRESLRLACDALVRALHIEGAFAPAHALRELANLELATIDGPPTSVALVAARAVAARFKDARSARVTAAFLDATLAFAFDADAARAGWQFSQALLAMPDSVGSAGRLYDRRSPWRDAPGPGSDHRDRGRASVHHVDDAAASIGGQPLTLFAGVMRAMARALGPLDLSRNAIPAIEAHRSLQASERSLR